MATIEKDIEQHLVRRCAEAGVLCMKFASPSFAGVPDRLLVGFGRTCFVECKAPGRKPRALQVKRIEQLRRAGAAVFVLDSREGCDDVLAYMKGTRKCNRETMP